MAVSRWLCEEDPDSFPYDAQRIMDCEYGYPANADFDAMDDADHRELDLQRAEISARACNILATAADVAKAFAENEAEPHREAKQGEQEGGRTGAPLTPEPVEKYVTLDQAAASVSRSKSTLRRYYDDDKLPEPDVPGKGGKPHEWKWSKLRPELERLFNRDLPTRFPGR